MKIRSLLLIALIGLSGYSCKQKSGPGPIDNTETDPLPLVVIDTNGNQIVNEPKVSASLQIWMEDNLQLDTPIAIEYRGSTSFTQFDKKSYGFESRDASDNDADIAPFNFPPEEDWILYGPYSDKTLLRNVLIMDLGEKMGLYTPRTKIIELEINEEYLGVYVWMEKIKRDDNRLPITELEPEDNSPETITGGYILKIDKTTGDTNNGAYTAEFGFRSVYDINGDSISYPPYGSKQGEETYFLYEEPDFDEITNEQKSYIENYIHQFETALLKDDFNAGERSYTQYIDTDSFVDFLILNELSSNPDAYRLSTFIHKDRDGKLKMGPIWDFNIAFGNDGRSNTDAWIFNYNDYFTEDVWLVPFWWKKLMEDPVFKEKVKTRWTGLRQNELSYTSIEQTIQEYVTQLEEQNAVSRNFNRWPVLGEQLPFNVYVGETYDDEINYLNNWLYERLNWMDSEINAF